MSMHEFKVGDKVVLNDNWKHDIPSGAFDYFKLNMIPESFITVSGIRDDDGWVMTGGYIYNPYWLDMYIEKHDVIKHAPFRHKFSKINYRNE